MGYLFRDEGRSREDLKPSIRKRMKEIAGSPFEQFEIIGIIPLKLGSTLDLTITNSTVYLAIALGVYTIAYNLNIERGLLVPTR